MDEEAIGLVLARATELRLNITNCIHKATLEQNGPKSPEQGELNEAEEDGEESGRLWNIRDALESLETQLSSLQAMQQNQKYEKEVALSDIEESRRVLLEKLKEYKGKDLEVIQEATVFASETVEQSSELLLPPYPTRPPLSIRIGYKSAGTFSSDRTNSIKKNPNEETQRNQSRGGLARFIGTVTKTVVTLVGVVSIFRMATSKPYQTGIKFDSPLKVLNMFLPPLTGVGGSSVECPPGKVLVVEDGKPRCLVKERVEVPFGIVSSVSTADVNLGCG